MDDAATVRGALLPGRELRVVEPSIWSVLPAESDAHRYDRLAWCYDGLVGGRLYNRVVWQAHPDEYRAFAREAIGVGEGPHLDAGCGSLLFTALAYRRSSRPIVGLDRSIGMLRRARARLAGAGKAPGGIALVQGDLFDLPFRPGSFATIMGMGLLHLFDDPAPLIACLAALLAPRGKLYLTSLVLSGRPVGDSYLRHLRRVGQVVEPRAGEEVRALIAAHVTRPVRFAVRGSMAYAVVGG